VTGATGYIGGRLVPELLQAGHHVVCLARNPAKLDRRPWRDLVTVVEGGVADTEATRAAMAGVDVAYYLVHSMGGHDDFAAADAAAAEAFRNAAAEAGVGQIVYLGGLGDEGSDLSEHLKSRHDVGRILAASEVPVTELRAAVIIGSGSASFEMLRALVEVLPVMVTPRSVNRTLCQPIGIRDMLAYLIGVAGNRSAYGRVLEVGGPDVVTYRQMMDRYAAAAGLPRRVVIPVRPLSPVLSSHWINVVTPLPIDLVRPLVGSLINDVVVKDRSIDAIVPRDTLSLDTNLNLALRRVSGSEVPTRWSGATPGRPEEPDPSDPGWSGGTLLGDYREVPSSASPERLMQIVGALGGRRGWLVGNWLWALRGALDKVLGGVGMRRGRRHPDEIEVGEALDFFRVEKIEPGRLLRLRAEMKVPGEAWLEWRAEPNGSGTTLIQRAIFIPRGLSGRAYWWATAPAHAVIFKPMVNKIIEAAESDSPDWPVAQA